MEVIYFNKDESLELFIQKMEPMIFYNFPIIYLREVINTLIQKSEKLEWYLNSNGNFIIKKI
jgi:hypothetical protein